MSTATKSTSSATPWSAVRCSSSAGARRSSATITDSAAVGIGVHDPKAKVSRNYAASNTGSGIELFDPGARVTRNTTNDNGEWGIKGVLGTIDGGRNRAHGNAEPAQCLNVICRN